MRLAAAALMLALTAAPAAAQGFGGYVSAGTGSIDYAVYRKTIPQATAGVLFTLPGEWLRIGGEADVMTSNGYFTGRGGPFAEFVVVRGSRVQPFVRGGYLAGEDSSPFAGGGVDFWLTDWGGVRVFVQDAFRRVARAPFAPGPDFTLHEPSFQVGWTWR